MTKVTCKEVSCSWCQTGGHVRSDSSSLTLSKMQWLWCYASCYFEEFTAQRIKKIWTSSKRHSSCYWTQGAVYVPCVSEALNNWWETAHVHRLHLWPELIRIIAIHEISYFLLLRGRRRYKTWGMETESHMDQFYTSKTMQGNEWFLARQKQERHNEGVNSSCLLSINRNVSVWYHDD